MPKPHSRFTQEFQDEAVRLVETSGRSRREIAQDLGIGLSTLRHWIDRRRFKTLKAELIWRTVFQTRAQAKKTIARYLDGFYNPIRRHSTLDFISPAQF